MNESEEPDTHHGFEMADSPSLLDEDGTGETPVAPHQNESSAAAKRVETPASVESNEFEFPSLFESESRPVSLSPEAVHEKTDRIWQEGRDSKVIQERIAVLLRAQTHHETRLKARFRIGSPAKSARRCFKKSTSCGSPPAIKTNKRSSLCGRSRIRKQPPKVFPSHLLTHT